MKSVFSPFNLSAFLVLAEWLHRPQALEIA
jgi:hypothetical protein